MENNDLKEKYKKFWLDQSKEEIIEAYFDSIENGEVLLKRIIKAIEYLEKHKDLKYTGYAIEILRGEDDRSN